MRRMVQKLKRDRALTVRLLENEVEMVYQLADHEGISVSEWVRNIIRREHVVTFGAKPKKKR